MKYSLQQANIQCDKEFKAKNSEDRKITIRGFSKKLFDEKQKAASKQAQQTKNYSLAYHVVGSTFFKEADEDDEDILEIEGKKYVICDGKFSFTKGYLYVGNNEFVRVKTRVPFIIWFLLIGVAVLGICLGLRSCQTENPDGPRPTEGSSLDFSIDGTDEGETTPNQRPHESAAEEYIEVTVFPEVVVDATTPNMPLYNSENNTVYFQFNIYEGDTLLHKTGLVPPGYRVQWNAKEALSVGKHDIRLVINCYDIETKAPCDGATTHCTVTVE